MLVLSRKVGESFVIGNDITVEIVEIRGNTIRIGIAAPRDVPVHREEVMRAIAREAAQAAANITGQGGRTDAATTEVE